MKKAVEQFAVLTHFTCPDLEICLCCQFEDFNAMWVSFAFLLNFSITF